jgi:hypothetical protein
MFMPLQLLKTYIRNPLLSIIFHRPTCLGSADANPDQNPYISTWGAEFCQVFIFATLVCQTVVG